MSGGEEATEEHDDGTDQEDADEEALIQEQQHRSYSSKWKKGLGAVMALGSSLVFTFNGLLIKKFQLDLVDTLFVRSLIQSLLLLIFLKIRGISFLPTFNQEPELTTLKKCWIYTILIFQGLCAGLIMMCSYLAVLYCPLGDALTVIYACPIFTMIFSCLILKIRQGMWKILFAINLIAGVILVVRPPLLFPDEDNPKAKDKTYWIGIGMSLGAACSGALCNVAINYLKSLNNGLIMLWAGLMSILSSILFISFDRNSYIFNGHAMDSTMVGHLFILALVGITANWMTIVSYQLLDPTICSVLRSQEIIFAYVIQALLLHEIPTLLGSIGATLVVISAFCMPLEKYVVPRFPRQLQMIC